MVFMSSAKPEVLFQGENDWERTGAWDWGGGLQGETVQQQQYGCVLLGQHPPGQPSPASFIPAKVSFNGNTFACDHRKKSLWGGGSM